MADTAYLLGETGSQESLQWAQKALAVDPDLAAAHQALATAYGQKGQFAKSRAEFKRAMELDPGDTVAIANLSMVLAQAAQFEESLRLAQRALEINPYSSDMYFHVFVPLQFLGSLEEQRRWIELWLARFPRSYRAVGMQLLLNSNEAKARRPWPAPARRRRCIRAIPKLTRWSPTWRWSAPPPTPKNCSPG